MFWSQEIFKCSFNFSFGTEWFWRKKYADAWKNGSQVGERSGEYGRCGKVLYTKLVTFCNVILATSGQVLPWTKIGSHCLTECAFHPIAISQLPRSCSGRIQESFKRKCHRQNTRLSQFRFWKVFGCFVMIKPLGQLFTIVIENRFFWKVTIWSRNGSFEFYRKSIEHTSKRRALWLSLSSCRIRL